MSEKPGLVSLIFAKVRALLPEQWRQGAGKLFRDTIGGVSEYSAKNVRIRERLDEAPDIGWNSLKVKSSEALLRAAEEENKRIATELARQTLADKARQEKATADRMETEARILSIKEIEERVTLVEKLRAANCVPVWDSKGNIRVLKAPPDYDWDGLTSAIVHTADLSLPVESDSELAGTDRDKSKSSGRAGTAPEDRE
ncbi:MAG TPA: hypothetical protein VHQ22_10845 [Terriglobales bacterium]|jgi:hypothetical protein|nr:hypothetical protein [Terriglobales bacterium]